MNAIRRCSTLLNGARHFGLTTSRTCSSQSASNEHRASSSKDSPLFDSWLLSSQSTVNQTRAVPSSRLISAFNGRSFPTVLAYQLNGYVQRSPATRPISCPTTIRPIICPTVTLNELLGQLDPTMPVVPMEAPSAYPTIEKRALRRMLKVRRKKMKKHKRRVRWKRDFHQYATYHRDKKAKSEKAFRVRMEALLRELDTFDAETYVRETIARAKVDPHEGLAWSGRKKHPHWSEFMTIEELYGLPKSDFIDKNAGYPDEDDANEIARLKADYYRRFRGIEINLEREDDPKKAKG